MVLHRMILKRLQSNAADQLSHGTRSVDAVNAVNAVNTVNAAVNAVDDATAGTVGDAALNDRDLSGSRFRGPTRGVRAWGAGGDGVADDEVALDPDPDTDP